MDKATIFVSYSHADSALKDRLLPHLKHLSQTYDLELWVDSTKLSGGQELDHRIEDAIARAVVILPLISADSLTSDYIRTKELPLIQKRQKERKSRVFPILLRDCHWEKERWLSNLVLRPRDGRPLVEWEDSKVDKAIKQIANDIEKYLSSLELQQQEESDRPPELPSFKTALPTNIPGSFDPFVGRESDLESLTELFTERKARLVTLLGPPGIGKTRLAREFGHKLATYFPGGCWFADLVKATSETGIAYEIGEALGAPLASSQSSSEEATAALLRARGPMLLILDNFEQVVHHAARTVGFWLQEVPEVRFLATSWRPLYLTAERTYYLESLQVPDADSRITTKDLHQFSSVELFIDRAQRYRRNFRLNDSNREAVLRICRGLEGNPLAIELATSALRMKKPQQVAENLDQALVFKATETDRQERHTTLKTAIEWRFGLLEEHEQMAFLQLSIFQDGFYLDAAEAVVDLSVYPQAPPTFEVIQKLLDCSLVKDYETEEEMRYDFYVAIYDYARDRWLEMASEAEGEALERRWANYYLGYGETLAEQVRSSGGKKALDRLGLELENLFGIQETFLERGEPTIAARAILALNDTMAVRGPAPLRVPKLKNSFEALGEDQRLLKARLGMALSAAFWARGEWNEAEDKSNEAVALARHLAPERVSVLAWALRQQGKMRTERGYLRLALGSYREAKEIFEATGERKGMAIVETEMGAVQDRLGDLKESLRHFEAAEVITEEIGDEVQRGMVHNRRGLALWHHGQLNPALESLRQAEEISRGVGNRAWIAAHLTNQGLVLTDLDRFDEALELFKEAADSHHELGYSHWVAVNFGGWGRALMMRGQLDDLDQAVDRIRQAEKLARRVYYPENIALHVGDLGRIYLVQGKNEEARKAVREAVALERRMGASRDLRHFNNLVTLARSCERLGREDELWELLVRARWLSEDLDIPSFLEIRKVGEDAKHLERMHQRWYEKYGDPPSHEVNGRIPGLLPPPQMADLELSSHQIVDLLERVIRELERPGYEYPWAFLEKELEERGEATLKLFGYGSLVNRESAERTIRPATPEGFRPVISFGVVRLLDYDMPAAVRSRSHYGQDMANPLARGLFNARFTGALSDGANGILVDVGIEDIEALRQREVGYDLRPIVCVPWEDPAGEPIHAYALGCSGRLWEGEMLSNRDLLPHRAYYQLCREGATKISEEFLSYWLKTAFLADGETTVAQWESGVETSL